MKNLHPDTEWLAEYAAGSLADSQALCVLAHLHHCSSCTAQVKELASVGGAMFDSLANSDSLANRDKAEAREPEAKYLIDESLIERTLSEISSEAFADKQPKNIPAEKPVAAAGNFKKLPYAFRKIAPEGLDNLKWKKFGSKLSIANIDNLDENRDVALHRLEPGATVGHHDHGGLEITVVLTGSFSDLNGQYHPGDFIVKQPGDQHRPTASENSACVCLSVTDAPVRFTGKLTRLLNPVMAFRHSK